MFTLTLRHPQAQVGTTYIPTHNLFCEHHFCFRYFNRYLGTPENCVVNKLKVGIGLLYDRYFKDISPDAVHSRQSNMCMLNKCSHNEREPVPEGVINTIPQWLYKEIYEDAGIPRVSFHTYICSHYFIVLLPFQYVIPSRLCIYFVG